MKKFLIPILKIAIPIAIIVWLCVQAQQKDPEIFHRLRTSEKNWSLLLIAFTLIFGANVLTFIRWHVLLRAVNIDISFFRTLRLGFMGFLLGFVAPGQVGGDLFKAVFIAREHRQRRTAAIATILIDRLCGLYGLLLVAAVGLLATGLATRSPFVAIVAKATYACAVLGAFAIIALLIPGMTRGRIAEFAAHLPRIGKLFRRLFNAVDMFRQRKPILALIGLLSVAVHVLCAAGLYSGARGIFNNSPTFSEHLVISPIAGVAGALPLFPGGAGSYEAAVKILYDLFSDQNVHGRGVIVGLLYRFTTILVAAVGLMFYWLGRRDVADVMERVQSESQNHPSRKAEKSVR